MSDKAACQKTRSPEGCDENGPAAALLLSHVSIQICSFFAPCRRPILIATPLHQSLTWCTRLMRSSSGMAEILPHLKSADHTLNDLLTAAPAQRLRSRQDSRRMIRLD